MVSPVTWTAGGRVPRNRFTSPSRVKARHDDNGNPIYDQNAEPWTAQQYLEDIAFPEMTIQVNQKTAAGGRVPRNRFTSPSRVKARLWPNMVREKTSTRRASTTP